MSSITALEWYLFASGTPMHQNIKSISPYQQRKSLRRCTNVSVSLITDNNNAATSNCGSSTTTSASMNKRHCDDSSLAPGSSRIPLTRSCSSPAVSHGESIKHFRIKCVRVNRAKGKRFKRFTIFSRELVADKSFKYLCSHWVPQNFMNEPTESELSHSLEHNSERAPAIWRLMLMWRGATHHILKLISFIRVLCSGKKSLWLFD